MDNRNLITGKPKPLLVYLVAIYAASLLAANILANHMIVFIRWTTSAGIITFPITYILASVLAEVYGYNWARRAAWLTLALNALMAGLIQVSIVLPAPVWYDGVYFATAIGGTWRIVLASLTAFTVGKYANDRVFVYLKGKHDGMAGFKFRAMASSIIGHVLDTSIFMLVAFAFVNPWGAIPEMIIVSVCLKWGYEWLALPLTVKIVKKVRAYEGLDT
ncbi:MAG: queuosine precursor transporter [Defluviitaleaceae bacterium]|nr:queuosine precursor transporter [Defluviitaleaceae bacterium]